MTLCIVLALIATSLNNLGMGLQKAGVEALPLGLRALRSPETRGPFLSWVFGTALTGAAIAVQFVALRHGPASVVAAMSGFGLVVLAAFSALALKEPLRARDGAGLLCILAGVVVVSLFGPPPRAVVPFHPTALIVAGSSMVAALALASWLASSSRGLLIGALAGAMGGCGLLVMKSASVTKAWAPTTAAWGLITAVSFAATQLAYRHGRAVDVVPAFTAASIVVPVLLAPLAFEEDITGPMVGGIAFLIAGIVLLRGKQADPTQAR